MRYTPDQVARAYQGFRRIGQPYYTIFDQSGILSPRVSKYFVKISALLYTKNVDVIEYFTFLFNYRLLPMPNLLHSEKLFLRYEEYKQLHTSCNIQKSL